MIFFDTHCHLSELDKETLHATLKLNKEVGVRFFCTPAIAPDTWEKVETFATMKGHCVAFGLHPWYVHQFKNNDLYHSYLQLLAQYLERYPKAAVGEIGLDLHAKRRFNFEVQKQVFREQITLAAHFKRPVIIHNVKATDPLTSMMKRYARSITGVVHGFAGSLEEAQTWLKLGFRIGVGGMLLRDNAQKFRHVIKSLPLESLLIESDMPFSRAGSENFAPQHFIKVAETLAALHNTTLEQVAEVTTNNAILLFQPHHFNITQ